MKYIEALNSKNCHESINVLIDELEHKQIWALKMVDAWGAPSSGFLQGNTLWTGRFTECLDSQLVETSNGTVFYIVDFGISVHVAGIPTSALAGKQGICLPSACDNKDMNMLANTTILQINNLLHKFNMTDLSLHYDQVEDVSEIRNIFKDIQSVSRLFALFIFFTLVIVATVLDLCGATEEEKTNTTDDLNQSYLETEKGEKGSVIITLTQDDTESSRESLIETEKVNNPHASEKAEVMIKRNIENQSPDFQKDIKTDETILDDVTYAIVKEDYEKIINTKTETNEDMKDEIVSKIKDENDTPVQCIVEEDENANIDVHTNVDADVSPLKDNNMSNSKAEMKANEDDMITNEGSMLKVLSDAGYKSLAENTLSEMGVDIMDTDDKNKTGQKEKRDEGTALDFVPTKNEYSSEPSLRNFRKIAAHSRDFSNILKKFRSFENAEENNVKWQQKAEKITRQVSLNLPSDGNQKSSTQFNSDKETRPIEPINYVQEKIITQKNQNVGFPDEEDRIDGIASVENDQSVNKEMANNIDNMQNSFSDCEAEKYHHAEEITVVEEFLAETFDSCENDCESTYMGHSSPGWPLRLGDMVQILSNEESLHRIINNQDEIEDIKRNSQVSKSSDSKLNIFTKAFSATRNLNKIFSISDVGDDLSCLHGIRFLSMTWVILGHTFYFSIPFLDNPSWALNKIQNTRSMEAVEQGTFSVDTFFFLSGLLVSYIFLTRRNEIQSLSWKFWIKFVLHRYLRILPPYIALVLLLEPLRYYFCTGPFCPPVNSSMCYTNWWKNILNVNNLWKETDMCAPWTWYLANDFQFFLLSPIFLITVVHIKSLAWVGHTLLE